MDRKARAVNVLQTGKPKTSQGRKTEREGRKGSREYGPRARKRQKKKELQVMVEERPAVNRKPTTTHCPS